jgi:hypothetical protein
VAAQARATARTADLPALVLAAVTAERFAMIDVNTEHMLPLSHLARRLPRRRSDRPVHPGTIHRWRRHGVRGVRLECVRIGGTWHTSLEAYQRWVEQLTAVETETQPGAISPQGQLGRTRRDEAVEEQLDMAGIR